MTEPLPPDDLEYLPRADQAAADAKAAKAALWKEIAERKKAAQAAKSSLPPPPPSPAEPEPPATLPPVPPVAAKNSGWDELLSTPLEELQGTYTAPVFSPSPSPPPRRRSIIRSPGSAVRPSEDPSFQQPSVAEEAAQPETPPAERETVISPGEPEASPPADPAPDSPAKPESPTPPLEKAATESGKPAELSTTAPASPPNPTANPESPLHRPLAVLLRQKWEQWGGASLSLSLGIHLFILLVGGFLVVNQVLLEPEVDFLPGGTKQGQAASQALEHKIQQKKNPWLRKPVPMRKLAAVGSISDIVLPDEVPDLLELPGSNDLLSNAKLGGAGLGGGGFGKGMGLGAKSGMVFQPLSMFGREIKAKRLAVILDVSGSMIPHLARVVDEVDKVARDSIVILFPGCGLEPPPPRGIPGKDIYRTNGPEFERFWRAGTMSSYDQARAFKIKKEESIENEAIFRMLAKRPQTYFIHGVGIGYTWLALLSDQVRQADALYWFSDFQDNADFGQLEIVRENLLRRGQRLYIQPYGFGGARDLVSSQLVQPTKGEVIEVQF